MISNTWVLFVRPKTAHFLLQDLERLREAAKVADKLPAGPHALFKDPSTEPSVFTRIPFRGVSSPNPEPVAGRKPEDLYFPKPYNHEQMQIVERLEQAPGVVAQGPPGTGKTHTIANIICHYLAKGQSILVTSKGEQALRVLKDKLPEGHSPPCRQPAVQRPRSPEGNEAICKQDSPALAGHRPESIEPGNRRWTHTGRLAVCYHSPS